MPTPDAGEASVVVEGGVLPAVDSGHGGPCNGGPCGVMVMPQDASEASWIGGGVLISPDSGDDASRGPCNGPCGVIIHPEAGFD